MLQQDLLKEVKVERIDRIPTEDGIQAIKDGKDIGTTDSIIWIDSTTEGRYVHYTAMSTYTGFCVDSVKYEKDGKLCYCLYDHSGTAVGYYKTKKDYLALEDALSGAGLGAMVVADSYGSEGFCKIYLDCSMVKKITIWN